MRKLKLTEKRSFTEHLIQLQGGVCPLCGKPVNFTAKNRVVLDHDHVTGLCRGALHNQCNQALGEIETAISRRMHAKRTPAELIKAIAKVAEYIQHNQDVLEVMYPTHKTEEELRLIRNKKAKEYQAKRRAKAAMAKMRKQA